VRAFALAAAAATLALGPSAFDRCSAQGCCRVCSAGKACGNSCIARWKTCHKGKGCACDG
jgi:hypothetical protein